MRPRKRQRFGRVSRSWKALVSVLALLAGGCAAAQAQMALPGRPAMTLIENAPPRVTGNSFVNQWRAEEFGGGSGNTAIVQHPATGYIYVGNSQGVLEFDGARWQVVPLPHSGAVLALAIDALGRVWASSENEIARLEFDPTGALHATTVVHPLPDGENGAIDQALVSADGVWFRGLQHILRVSSGDRVVTWRTGERFGPMWWMEDAVHAKISEREIVRLEEGGALRTILTREAMRVPPNRPSPFRVFAAREVRKGEWILLTPLGPVRWVSGGRTWRPMPTRPALFRDTEAIAATFLDDGAMVFVTTRPGGFVVKPDGTIERLLDRLPALMNPRIASLLADHEGGLWVTSRDYIARLQLRSAVARHEGLQGMQGNPRQLLRHSGTLFVAHSGGVSRHIDWPGAFPPADGLHRGADALAVVGDRVFAAATGLVELVDGGLVARPWSDLAVTTLTGVRTAPDVILAGDAQGVWAFRAQAAEWKPEGRLQNLRGSIATLFDRGDGWVWGAMTDGRIWRADLRDGLMAGASGTLAPPLKFYGPGQGVPATARAGRIAFFSLGETTVATCSGWLLRHDAATDQFVPETRITGFSAPESHGAEAIGAGADGTWWLRMGAPDRRILQVKPDGQERWRLEELAAPMIRELAAVSLYQDARTLWVAGKDLLVSIDLDWRPATPLPPLTARVRRVVSDAGQPIWRDTAGNATAPLALTVGQNSVRFEFSAPAFAADHRGRPTVQYRTQLGGFDHGWSVWSEEPWRDFTRLPAGRFTFHVQARDQAGRTSPEAELAVVVTAPWWRTRWAWAGYASSLGVLLASGVALRTRALRRRAQRLEAIVAARTEELRRSNVELARLHRLELDEKSAARLAEEEARLEVLRYQLNPHFLYNALNSIYSLVLTTPPAAANMVLRLSDFCRVALDRRHEEHTTVGAEFDKLSIYLDIEKVRWGDSLHIAVEADEAARRAQLPPFLLLPLVENAMKYGGATSPEELHVRVSARLESDASGDGGGTLVLTVANSGEWVQRTGSSPPFSGIGLTNLRQRLQRYHPNTHEITIDTKDSWVVVTLKLAIGDCRLPIETRTSGTAV